MKTPILGSSYVARSVNAADNRMVNLFPEVVPEGGKEPAFLQRAPGLVDTGYLTATVAINALHAYVFTQVEYLAIVRGQQVYTSANGAAPVYRGNISAGVTDNLITMAHNDTQVFIANRRENTGWVLDMFGLVPIQVAGTTFAPNYIGVGTVIYLDGFFVFNTPGTNKMYVTDLLDGTVIDPLAFATADASPDIVQTIATVNNELWVFGANSTEVWYNAGATPFPFEPIQGSFTEVGCSAIASVATLDNSLFWLGKDNRGAGIVYRTNGYRAERISTHAVEWQIQQYSTVTDAIAYTYQQDGHAFYVITFPTASATWVYDASTQAWHERAAWDGSVFSRHIANCQAFYKNEVIVGTTTGLISEVDPDVYQDNGVDSKWLRSWRALPTGTNNLKRTAHHSLQLDCETGAGGTVDLRWSDDGGHSWSNAQNKSMGNPGETWIRVIWRRLGMTKQLRDRVYEVSGTDANKVYIMGAELLMSPTDA